MTETEKQQILKLRGPIFIFGAGGFVGFNLFLKFLQYRDDVFGISRDWSRNWRLSKRKIPKPHCINLDIGQKRLLNTIIRKYQPKTIFNLAAYGAYSFQTKCQTIYKTNFLSHIDLIEVLKKYGFESYIYTGSSSEYGLNCSAPKETDQLLPNSHYAVSKAAVSQSISYYGKVEKLPVIHTRLYSVYGPWEEPTRLIPTLIRNAIDKRYPDYVNPTISRDFIYVDDVTQAMITLSSNIQSKYYGETYNIGTGEKTTIKKLAYLSKDIFDIPGNPKFSTLNNKSWDLDNWFGNPNKIYQQFKWNHKFDLAKGLQETYKWHIND